MLKQNIFVSFIKINSVLSAMQQSFCCLKYESFIFRYFKKAFSEYSNKQPVCHIELCVLHDEQNFNYKVYLVILHNLYLHDGVFLSLDLKHA